MCSGEVRILYYRYYCRPKQNRKQYIRQKQQAVLSDLILPWRALGTKISLANTKLR